METISLLSMIHPESKNSLDIKKIDNLYSLHKSGFYYYTNSKNQIIVLEAHKLKITDHFFFIRETNLTTLDTSIGTLYTYPESKKAIRRIRDLGPLESSRIRELRIK